MKGIEGREKEEREGKGREGGRKRRRRRERKGGRRKRGRKLGEGKCLRRYMNKFLLSLPRYLLTVKISGRKMRTHYRKLQSLRCKSLCTIHIHVHSIYLQYNTCTCIYMYIHAYRMYEYMHGYNYIMYNVAFSIYREVGVLQSSLKR